MKIFLTAVFMLLSLWAHAAAPQRVVVLGGALTEIVYAFDAQNRLVGVDQSSVYPAATASIPKVGYYRSFSVEGVLSLRPDLILASDQAGPPEAIAQLRSLGKRVVVLSSAATLDALEQRIYGVAGALQLRDDGRAKVANLRAQLKLLANKPAAARPNALVLFSRGGAPEGAGRETAADATVRLAGFHNVLAGQKGYKPLSLEGIAQLKPQYLITTTMSVAALGGMEKVLALPGVASTPAVRQGNVLVLDDLLLLGFGPRLPEAIAQLQRAPRPARLSQSGRGQ
ncbi:hemin ABC transporter substrate-binding protein [Chitinibacter sp. GC72]|uniref:heme/hemin ABC transporter substrate-binding protein n=1 Tax=Chitinibacter sp. GC72 TaxID=1526917 RepID=UPI001E2E124C|nr:ABC transporter substrate-binding protein [Chitinibacter sp. GC72]